MSDVIKAQFLAQVEATRQLGKSLLIEFVEPVVKAEFYGTDLSSMGLVHIRFSECTFETCDFSHILVMSTTFHNCTFRHCTFERALFHPARFISCDFSDCQFERASICGTMTENKFTECSFVDADYVGTSGNITDKFIRCEGVIDMGADRSGVRYIAFQSRYEVIGGYVVTWGTHSYMRSEIKDRMRNDLHGERWILPRDCSAESRIEYDLRCADFLYRIQATDKIARLNNWKVVE